jgi:uncharacterized membrane protein YqjE
MRLQDHEPPGMGALAAKLVRTGLGALQNRIELLAVEWQEERIRLMELLVWGLGLLFLGIMGLMLLTGTIILIFPEDLRLYVAAGFTVLYLLGAAGAWFGIRSLLKHEPFTETVDQVKKDRLWIEGER